MASDTVPTRQASRPLSPHLQIWRFTVSMAASITHRATGMALYGGTILLAIWAFALSRGEATYLPVANFLGSPFGTLILFGFVWSLLFHAFNGVRHLYWDMGRGLDAKTVRMTAWLVYAASILFAVIIVATAVAARG